MPKRWRTLLLVIPLAWVGIGQCAAAQDGMPPVAARPKSAGAGAPTSGGLGMVPEDFAKLKIAPGFLLGVEVLEDADFNGGYRVDQQGYVDITGLGPVHVADGSAEQARAAIRKALVSAQLLKNPQVNVRIVEYTTAQVSILGEVNAPGKYPLLAPRPLVDVLAMAGGETIAAGSLVQIIHHDGKSEMAHYTRSLTSDPRQVVMINPGDTVEVNRAGIIYVMGAVNRPGGYIMQEEGSLDLLQAITLAGGPSGLAQTSTLYVLRKDKSGSTVYIELPFKKIVKGEEADVQLQAADIIFIPTSKFKSIYSSTQYITQSAASAALYKY